MPQPVDRMRWREAIMSELGPPNPLARIVLMAVSMPMHNDGTGAWEAQTKIADRAAVGLRTVKRHLEIAERHGWIERKTVKVAGRQWRRTEYSACVPDDVYFNLPEKPWEEDPTWRRSQPSQHSGKNSGKSPAPHKGPSPTTAELEAIEAARRGATAAPCKPDVVPATTGRGANGARRGANDDIDVVPSCGLLIRNLNHSMNHPSEGALARTALAKAMVKSKEQEATEAEEKRALDAQERVRKARESFPQDKDNAEMLAKLAGATKFDAQWVIDHDEF